MGNSWMFQGYFKNAPSKLQGYFQSAIKCVEKDVSKVFQASPKVV